MAAPGTARCPTRVQAPSRAGRLAFKARALMVRRKNIAIDAGIGSTNPAMSGSPLHHPLVAECAGEVWLCLAQQGALSECVVTVG